MISGITFFFLTCLSVNKKQAASYQPLGVFNSSVKSTNLETLAFGRWYKGICKRVLNVTSHIELKVGEQRRCSSVADWLKSAQCSQTVARNENRGLCGFMIK